MSITLRRDVRAGDPVVVRDITESTGFFYTEEVGTAVELVEERLAKGEASGYSFVFADDGGRTIGYACFGPIACTKVSFDLYWIAVHADGRGKGLGTILLDESERLIREAGGRRIYAETSSRPLYEPTRAFYLARGYREEARLAEFYGPGDAKVIYVKEV
ncbi:MAG: GNAT family N-acetyltransferase [Spirochaetes bacterium]|nr:GNAT family N-acetyltransferase [Spirochaetota bacterium]